MKIFAYSRFHTIPRIPANCPGLYPDTSASSNAGYLIDAHLPDESGDPEPLPAAGKSVIDFSTMTARQRHAYLAWIYRKWNAVPPDPGFFDQAIHALEADILLNDNPDYESVPLLVYLIEHHSAALERRKQIERVLSVLQWTALGNNPGASLKFANAGPWRTPEQINAALSALRKHGVPLEPQLAHRLCSTLLDRVGGDMSSVDSDLLSVGFEHTFRAKWPNGIKLEQPHLHVSITHQAGHPDTDRELGKDPDKFARAAWDFIADPLQFEELFGVWLKSRTQAGHSNGTLDRVNGNNRPLLGLLKKLPDSLLEHTLVYRIRAALPRFLANPALANLIAEAQDVDFEEISVDLTSLNLREKAPRLPFTFEISALPNDIAGDVFWINGEAVAVLGAGGSLTFESVSAHLESDNSDAD